MTKLTLTDEEKAVLRSGMCIGWPDPYFEEFVKRCEATGLSPFKQQVYGRLQSRREGPEYVKQLVFITSIGALRSIAEETGRYRGRIEPLFAGEELRESHELQEELRGELRKLGRQIVEATDHGNVELAKAKQEAIQEVLDREGRNEAGIWKGVWTGEKPPFAAKVGVRSVDLAGNEHVTYHTAKFAAYVQTNRQGEPSGLWAGELRDNQLAKCAEAGALRAAFPDELGGVYTADEMANKLAAGEQEEIGKIQDVGVRKNKVEAQEGRTAGGAISRESEGKLVGSNARNGEKADRPKTASASGKKDSAEEIEIGVPWDYRVEGNPLDVKITPAVSRVVALHGKAIRDLSEENVRFFARVSVRGGDQEKIRFYRALYQVVGMMDDSGERFENDLERINEVVRERISKGCVLEARFGSNGVGAQLEERIETANKRQSYAMEKKAQEFVSVEKLEIVGRAVRVKIGEGTAFVPQSMARESGEAGKVSIPKWLFEEKQQEAVANPQRRSAGVKR
jgi:hypothetical protein